MPIMEISVVPVGTKETSVGSYVAAAEEALRDFKVKSQLTAMGTIVEAESLEILFNIAAAMHKKVLESGAERILTDLRIDDRHDKINTMEGKVRSVEEKLK